MARVSTIAQYVLLQNSILTTQQRVFERQAQISSGQQSQSFAGIAKNAQRLVSFEALLNKSQEFIEQNTLIDSRAEIMDSSIAQMFDVASELKSRLIQRIDASTGTNGALAQEAQNMLDTVAGLLNTQINGRYLFAGSMTQTEPVPSPVPDPTTFGVADATYYQGDSVELTARASENIEVTYGIAGNRTGFQQLIGGLKAAIRGDGLDSDTLLNSAIALTGQAMDALNSYRNELGATLNVVARATEGHHDTRLYAESAIIDIENVDIPAAVAALSSDQIVLEASYLTITQLGRLSLTNYLS
jgi:flagellar hook-associated protein 3 FlgL